MGRDVWVGHVSMWWMLWCYSHDSPYRLERELGRRWWREQEKPKGREMWTEVTHPTNTCTHKRVYM